MKKQQEAEERKAQKAANARIEAAKKAIVAKARQLHKKVSSCIEGMHKSFADPDVLAVENDHADAVIAVKENLKILSRAAQLLEAVISGTTTELPAWVDNLPLAEAALRNKTLWGLILIAKAKRSRK